MLPEVGKQLLGSSEFLWLLLWAECPSGHIDCQSAHSQRCLFGCLAEPETYPTVVGIEWDTFWLYCQNLVHLCVCA